MRRALVLFASWVLTTAACVHNEENRTKYANARDFASDGPYADLRTDLDTTSRHLDEDDAQGPLSCLRAAAVARSAWQKLADGNPYAEISVHENGVGWRSMRADRGFAIAQEECLHFCDPSPRTPAWATDVVRRQRAACVRAETVGDLTSLKRAVADARDAVHGTTPFYVSLRRQLRTADGLIEGLEKKIPGDSAIAQAKADVAALRAENAAALEKVERFEGDPAVIRLQHLKEDAERERARYAASGDDSLAGERRNKRVEVELQDLERLLLQRAKEMGLDGLD